MAEHGSDFKESGPQLGVPVSVKELDDVLFKDVGNKIANDGRLNKLFLPPPAHTHTTHTHTSPRTQMHAQVHI